MCAELIHDYLELASATEWSWPTTPDELRKFAGQLCQVAASFRAMTRNGYGLKGGKTETARYLVKHFTRAMLLQSPHSGYDRYASGGCVSSSDAGLGECSFSEVLSWTPDKNEHCELFANMRCSEVERLFGVSPLLLSCWTCLVGQVPAEGRSRLIEADSEDIRAVLDLDEMAQLQLAPAQRFRMGPRALAEALRIREEGVDTKVVRRRPASV